MFNTLKHSYIFCLIICLIVSCTEAKKYKEIKSSFAETKFSENKINLDSIISILPTYETVTAPLKILNTFNINLLQPIINDNKTISIKSNAFLLGVYLADLGYARYYQQVQVCMNYIEALQKVGQELSLTSEQFNNFIISGEAALESKEMMFQFIDSTYNISIEYFKKNEMYAIAAIVSSGLWLESLKIVSLLDLDEEIKHKIIANHKQQLEYLLLLLNSFENDKFIAEISKELNWFCCNDFNELEYIKTIQHLYTKFEIN